MLLMTEKKKLLLEVDNAHNKFFIDDNIINKSDKLPNKIKSVLGKGKLIDEGRNNNMKLNMLINDCINVENSSQEINTIYDFIEKSNSNKNIKIMFIPDDNGINEFIKVIGSYGNISDDYIQIDSKLVSNLDMNKIQDWLKESLGEAKIKRYELIYRATEHGDSDNVLFQRCKNQANLLWIMKNKNNNNIFGCFNSIPISTNGNYSKDAKCFLFSLNKNKKYKPNLNIENNIYHCSSHIIEFGNNSVFEFYMSEKFLSSATVGFKPGPIFQHNNELSDNASSITLSELEVFRLIE